MTQRTHGYLGRRQCGPTGPAALAVVLVFLAAGLLAHSAEGAVSRDYYYTRTRTHPNHLRVSEELKNKYVDETKYEAKINGTLYEYYRSSRAMSYDELVFQTIDKIFQHRLSPFYLHHYDHEHERRASGDPALVSPEACARDLMYLVDKLPARQPSAAGATSGRGRDPDPDDANEHLTPELQAFFDSYARQEAGLLMGNTFWVGAYDQCVGRHIFELLEGYPRQPNGNEQRQQVVSFQGRYCVASLRAPVWEQLIEAKKAREQHYFKSERELARYAQLFRLQLGICLPDSCDSTALERHADELRLLTKWALGDSRLAHYDLADLYCLPDEASPLRQWSASARAFLAFVTVWLAAVLLATLADVFELFPLASGESEALKARPVGQRRPAASRLPQLVSWFSLRANYMKLMHVSPPAATDTRRDAASEGQATRELAVDLRFLNALKVLVMFWIINGHIMLLMIQTAKNILESDALLNGLMHFLIGATFGVDLFFTMTGFLTAYLLFNSGYAHKMRPATWLYLTFHRYWRLAPMYLLSFWFSRSLVQLLGSGPLWDYGTSAITFRGLCNTESWWYPASLTSNLHGLFDECMITSWYISCDMQFWLVSPIFLHLLTRSPAQGWLVGLATIGASVKARYDAILVDKSARYDELVQPRADIFMRVSHDLPALYTHPHFRIAAYIVGLLAGHYVYMIKSAKWKSVLTAELAERQQQQQPLSHTTPDEAHEAPELDGKAVEHFDHQKQQLFRRTPKWVDKNNQEKPQAQLTRAQRCRRTRTVLAYTGLGLFLVMAFISYLFANFFPAKYLAQARQLAALLYSVDHLAMSLGASLIIVSICMGHWPALNTLLAHPNWTRLSKLNYALLLLQCEAIYYQIFRYQQVPMAGTRELVNILFNLLVTLYPLAFAATLVFEFPLANIEKLLLGGGRAKN